MTNNLHLFGIRHHGPGSARSLVRGLEGLQPDCILIEGPPEADLLIPLAASDAMKPPVALLIYVPDQPSKAVFYPFTVFSPEWSAMQYSLANGIPARFMDLAQKHQLALEPADETADEDLSARIQDPLLFLAQAAGYEDGERWWEAAIEHRRDDLEVFAAIQEAMSALREEFGPDPDTVESLREASMRQNIRKANRDGFERIAVVCGAWHVPALTELDKSSRTDTKLLESLPKIKTAATWVPWTNARLSYRSGYGAGIESPGWYAHLWETEKNVTVSWMAKVAHLLREKDLDSSPAHIIEAVRLAETLATLRDKSLPGLTEMNDAVRTVFCFGSDIQLRFISEKLIIGDKLGSVPPETPSLPLQQDFGRTSKRLRLILATDRKTLDLDLRNQNELEKSLLLHRMDLLGIPWGKSERVTGAKGSFREQWTLVWHPEFVVALIEASVWGNTIYDAAEAKTSAGATSLPNFAALTKLLDKALLAGLPSAVQKVMDRLQEASAGSTDVSDLMEALSPLSRVLRYGNIRNTETALIAAVVDGIVLRMTIGLPAACSSLDDDAANSLSQHMISANAAVDTLQIKEYTDLWHQALTTVADLNGVHGLVGGRCLRMLFRSAALDSNSCALRLSRSTSAANEPQSSAAWIEGFLENSGQMLILHDDLLNIVDDWMVGNSDEAFTELLPLVRRTFSTFTAPERRQLGERLATGRRNDRWLDEHSIVPFDYDRADAALPLLRLILGLDKDTQN